MIKIGFNITPLSSAHKTRGIGYYTKNLLEYLQKRDDLDVITFTDIKELKDVDLIHFTWFDLFFRSLSLRKKFPTIVTVHDVSPLIFPSAYPLGLRAMINFQIQKFSLSRCQAIITDSQNSQNDISRLLKINSNKIFVVPLAADNLFRVLSDSEKIHIKRKYHLPDKFLLYVGDANFVKNIPFLIDGFKILKEDKGFADLKLVLIGEVFLKKVEGEVHPELKSLSETLTKIKQFNLQDEVLMTGHMDTEDLVGFYNLATCYIQPSLYEGFGLPVLEALSCGCPVLSSGAGSLKEVGGDALLYFEPQNINQFVKLLRTILGDISLQNKLSKLGINQAAKFSWEKTAEKTVQVYKEVYEKNY